MKAIAPTADQRWSNHLPFPATLLAAFAFSISLPAASAMPATMEIDIVSDTSWVCSTTGSPGWREIAFDDSSWTPAIGIPGYPYPPGNFIPGTTAQHIWEAGYPTTSPAYFRRSFMVPFTPESSQAVVRVDDVFEFYLNGELVGYETGVHPARTYDITPNLRVGKNVFALRCRNTIGGNRALLFDADVILQPVEPPEDLDIVSDSTWLSSATGPGGWTDLGFDSTGWTHTIYFNYPYPPTAFIPGTLGRHIWHNPHVTNPAYFRKTFTIPGFPLTSQGIVRVDDAYEFHLNGTLVGEKPTIHPSGAQTYDISPYLQEGENVFAIKGIDLGGTRATLFDADVWYIPNRNPVADAGPSQSVQLAATAHLDGTGSSDDYTHAVALSYAWTIKSAPAGSTAMLTGAATDTPTLKPDLPGDFVMELTVADGSGLQATAETTVSATEVVSGGSFESGLGDWIGSGNVEIQSGPPYSSTDGSQLIAFNASNSTPNGVLSQVVPTIPGQAYLLEFDVGVLAFNRYQQAMEVTVVGNSGLISSMIRLKGLGGGGILWVPKSYTFVADSTATTLSFSDRSPATNSIDLLLDHVRITSQVMTLFVNSVPDEGVGITLTPPDASGNGDGDTTLRRYYNPGTAAMLTAPLEAHGRTFFNWLLNGAHHSSGLEADVVMDVDHQLTAVYWGGYPIITEQPLSTTAVVDGAAVFRVAASGGAPLAYQWRYHGSDIPGAIGRELTIAPVAHTTAGTYDVVISNTQGTVTSAPAALRVETGFTGLQNGSFESDFQGWTVSGNLSVQSAPPYTFTDGMKLAAFNAGDSTPNGVLSQAFTTTPGQTYLLSFDMGVLAFNKSVQKLMVEVTGSPSLLSQTFAISGIGGGNTRWVTQNLQFTADSNRTTVAFHDVSTVTGSLDLVLDRVAVTPKIIRSLTVETALPRPVRIEVSPPDINAEANGTPTFTRSYVDGSQVTLTAPASYGPGFYPDKTWWFRFEKWRKNGMDAGTDPAITVNLTSDTVMTAVFVERPPLFGVQPADTEAGLGGDATFHVEVFAWETPLSYQWRRNGTPIGGTGTDTLSLANVMAGDAGNYDVVVTDNTGASTTSEAASLVVLQNALLNRSFEAYLDDWNHTGNVRAQSVASAPDGMMAAAFNTGNSATDGTVFQSFATAAGTSYQITFEMGVVAYNTLSQRLSAEVDGMVNLAGETYQVKGAGGGKAVWTTRTLTFTADGGIATVIFSDLSGGTTNSIDLLLDHVRITELAPVVP